MTKRRFWDRHSFTLYTINYNTRDFLFSGGSFSPPYTLGRGGIGSVHGCTFLRSRKCSFRSKRPVESSGLSSPDSESVAVRRPHFATDAGSTRKREGKRGSWWSDRGLSVPQTLGVESLTWGEVHCRTKSENGIPISFVPVRSPEGDPRHREPTVTPPTSSRRTKRSRGTKVV